MQDALAVRVVHRAARLDEEPHARLAVEPALVRELGHGARGGEVLARHPGQGPVGTVVRPRAEDARDVRVVEPGERAGLDLEALLGPAAVEQDLEGDAALRARLQRLVDLPHPADTDGREDPVPPEDLADERTPGASWRRHVVETLQSRRPVEDRRPALVGGEQGLDLADDRGPLGARAVEEDGAVDAHER